MSMRPALLATVALSAAGEKVHRGVGHLFAALALGEVFLGLMMVDGTRGALREALVAGVGLTVLRGALIRRAVEEEDELSAYFAQGAVALGYLGLGVSMWPYLVPRHLTSWDTAAPPTSPQSGTGTSPPTSERGWSP